MRRCAFRLQLIPGISELRCLDACIRPFFKFPRFKANHFLDSGMRSKAFAMFDATINGILREFACLSCFIVGQIGAGFAAAKRPTSPSRSRQNGAQRAATGFRSVSLRLCSHLIAVDISFPRLRANVRSAGVTLAFYLPFACLHARLCSALRSQRAQRLRRQLTEAATLTTMQSMCYGT